VYFTAWLLLDITTWLLGGGIGRCRMTITTQTTRPTGGRVINKGVIEMAVQPEVVALLNDMERPFVHRDGRPFTPAEMELFGGATGEDLEVAVQEAEARAAAAFAKGADHERLAELLRPYGQQTTLAKALPLMAATDRAEAEEIMARLEAAES
jgi:hypothetical protein